MKSWRGAVQTSKLFCLSAILIVAAVLLPLRAHADEIYTFITRDCRQYQGLIIGVTDTTVSLLDLNGNAHDFLRAEINALVIHNVVENPIPIIHMSPELNKSIQFVVMNDKKGTQFSGWPVRFVENYVIYHDVDGKSRVVDLSKVDRIRPFTVKHNTLTREGQIPDLSVGDVAYSVTKSCRDKERNDRRGVVPTRTLSDKIQISEFLSEYQKGFERVESFRERTYLYAKPYLYEKSTKLGLRFGQAVLVPSRPSFYVQWSTGQEYRFQSFNQLGTALNEYAPTIDPLFLARSDLKSHFFHASFVGNLTALSAGSDTLQTQDDEFSLRNSFNKKGFSSESFNYLALMGGDWGPWSVSFGTFYPNEFLVVDNSLRDIMASSVSPIYRIMFTTRKFQGRILYSPTRLNVNSPGTDEMVVEDGSSTSSLIKDFSYNGYFIRGGVTWHPIADLELGADQIILHGSYGADLVAGGTESFGFDQYLTEASIRHWFGRYVTLRLIGDFVTVKNNFRFSSSTGTEHINTTRLGGVFEFVF